MHFLKLRARFWLPFHRSALRARDRTPQMHFVSFDCNWIFYAPNTSKVHVYSHFSLSAVSYHFHTIGSKVSAWWAPKIEKKTRTRKNEYCWKMLINWELNWNRCFVSLISNFVGIHKKNIVWHCHRHVWGRCVVTDSAVENDFNELLLISTTKLFQRQMYSSVGAAWQRIVNDFMHIISTWFTRMSSFTPKAKHRFANTIKIPTHSIRDSFDLKITKSQMSFFYLHFAISSIKGKLKRRIVKSYL